MDKKEMQKEMLMNYLKKAAEDLSDFCKKNEITGFGIADVTAYLEPDCYLDVYVSVSNKDAIYTCSKSREDGCWGEESAYEKDEKKGKESA